MTVSQNNQRNALPNGLGGVSLQTYHYDAMNRLTHSSGGNSDAGVSYDFQQTYSPSGRIGDKTCDFTHSDHLGSSSWTTDVNGHAIQHIEYLPFGEKFVNQRLTPYEDRYTFTGKELDAESNLYYYDARYNSSTYSQFTSPDPMSDKYPDKNPFLYCSGNPIMRIDPDGRADYYDENGNHLGNDGVKDKKIYQQNPNGNVSYGDYKTPFIYVGDVDRIAMEYSGHMNYDGSKKSVGFLTVTQYVGDKKFKQNFAACSGTNTQYYTLQNELYHCYKYEEVDVNKKSNISYYWDGVGFKINLMPTFSTNRTSLQIHPDGGKKGVHDGTQGCIGLLVDGVELRRFARIVEPFIPISYNINNKQSVPIVPLVVYILGNPDCYQAEPVKCNNK